MSLKHSKYRRALVDSLELYAFVNMGELRKTREAIDESAVKKERDIDIANDWNLQHLPLRIRGPRDS